MNKGSLFFHLHHHTLPRQRAGAEREGGREQQPERRARRGMSSVRPSAGGSDVGRPRPPLLLPGGEKERIIGGPAAHLRAAEEESVGTHFESKQPPRLLLFPPQPANGAGADGPSDEGDSARPQGGRGGKELRCGERRARDSKVARAHEGRSRGELPSSALLLVERSRYHRGGMLNPLLSPEGERGKRLQREGERAAVPFLGTPLPW